MFLFRNPRPRTASRLRLPILALVLLAVAACGTADDTRIDEERSEPDAQEAVAPDPMEGLQVTVGMESLEYEPGEPLPVTIQLSNQGDEPRNLNFRTAQRFDLILRSDSGEELQRWSVDQAFAQVLEVEEIPPRADGPLWEVEWVAPSEPGRYRLEVVVLPAEGELGTEVPIEVSG